MLNYNLNIIDPLQQEKKGSDFRPFIYWGYEDKSLATGSPVLPPNSFSTMSIVAPASNAVNITTPQINSFSTDTDSVVSASLSGSKWAVTGSTTMSLDIVGVPMNSFDPYYYYFASVSGSAAAGNITSRSATVLQNSFTASNFYNYFISGSVIHWKGNQSNAPINWKIGVTSPSASFVSASFILKSDTQTIVSQSYATASASGSYGNNYAFSQTASLYGFNDPSLGTSNWWDSSYNFKEYTMSLSIPKIGFSTSSYSTTGFISASFVESTFTATDITASIELKPWTPYEVEIVAIGGGGAGGGSNYVLNSGGGGGAGAAVSASWFIPVSPTLTYFDITIGAGGTCPKGNYSGSKGDDTTVYWNNVSASVLIAKGGSGGVNFGESSADGGSTGGTVGANGLCGSVLTNTIPVSASYALVPQGHVGSTGHIYRSDIPVPFSNLGGGGGGALTAGDAGSSYNGGAGGTGISLSAFGLGTVAAGGPGGSYNIAPAKMSDGTPAAANTGNGGGGANGGDTPSKNVNGGAGGSGIVIIRYKGPQVGTGGNTITTANGYTTHIFTSAGQFYPTANFRCCA
jgi:hypothetical protein